MLYKELFKELYVLSADKIMNRFWEKGDDGWMDDGWMESQAHLYVPLAEQLVSR